jgi:hypothetical protein
VSWSFYVGPVDRDGFDTAIDDARAAAQAVIEQNNPDGADQADLAVELAKRIVASGVVGAGGRVAASLGGHGNPGHRPLAGWANDTITVSVGQAD